MKVLWEAICDGRLGERDWHSIPRRCPETQPARSHSPRGVDPDRGWSNAQTGQMPPGIAQGSGELEVFQTTLSFVSSLNPLGGLYLIGCLARLGEFQNDPMALVLLDLEGMGGIRA